MRATAKASDSSLRTDVVRGLLLLWAVAVCIRDAIAPTRAISATLAALLQPLWLLRAAGHDASWPLDLAFVLVADYWSNGIFKPLPAGFYEWFRETQGPHISLYGIFLLIGFLSAIVVVRGDAPSQPRHDPRRKTDEYFLPPLLVPSLTTHTRLFPKKHSFSYSYFLVGIPVGWRGCAGSALSADVELLQESERRNGWFNVHAEDHLDREPHTDGLEGKLRRYLHTQGVEDSSWTFAYLVTAPRFLGYSFNPVSFWYIYDSDVELRMMILEVNNTFDERRMYLLKTEKGPPSKSTATKGELNAVDEDDDLPTTATRFTNTWEKDFHVSPFNSRKGTYSLAANDPLSAMPGQGHMLDNTIVLRSSKSETKLVARVFSTGKPQDPFTMSTLELVRFLAAWFWVGFVTFPRIVRQAGRLYFQRSLHVWFRPEVLPSGMGRKATTDEAILERFFRLYLKRLTQQTHSPLRVHYTPSSGLGQTSTFTSPVHDPSISIVPELRISITSPTFYTRFVHYAHTREAFNRECLHASDPKSRTLDISPPALLDTLLDTRSQDSTPPRPINDQRNMTSSKTEPAPSFRWTILKSLRCPPPEAIYIEPNARSSPSSPSSAEEKKSNVRVTDIRTLPLSPLDNFVRTNCEDSEIYRRVVCELFVAQRLFAGSTALVSLADWLVRWLMVLGARSVVQRTGTGVPFFWSLLSLGSGSGSGWDLEGLSKLVLVLGVVNMPHLWSLGKAVGSE